MNRRILLTAGQLLQADSVASQVDNSAFLADATACTARHGLGLSLEIGATRMNCSQQGVRVNREAVDLFPAVVLPLDRDLLRDQGGDGYWDLTLSPGKALKLVRLADTLRPC